MSSRERRRSTPLPAGSDADVDFRSATEAMQRAADAMIAATESFRKQFHQQDINAGAFSSNGTNTGHSSGNISSGNSSGSNNSNNSNSSGSTTRPPPQRGSSRRRPVSYQPYRPPEAAVHVPNVHAQAARPRSASGSVRSQPGSQGGNLASGGVPTGGGLPVSGGSSSAKASAYPPPVHRRDSVKTSSRNPYSMYRATRASTGSPAPPVSLHNNTLHNTHIPISEYFAALPADAVPRDDSGIAMALSLSNPQLQPAELPEPPALPPLTVELQQHLQQQQQQYRQLADNGEAEDEILPGSSSSQRASAQHASWALLPTAPKTPDAAHVPPPRRLTPPVLPAATTAAGPSRSPVGGGRRPSMSSYVDLIEAASRLKRTHSYQGAAHAGEPIQRDASITPVTLGGGATDDGEATTAGETDFEPVPVLQIGRYTYVRSEAGGDAEYRTSLIRDDGDGGVGGSRRYTTMPLPGRGSSLGYHRHSLNPPPPPPEAVSAKSAMGPYGFSLAHESCFVLVVCLAQMLMLAGIAQALVPAAVMGLSFPDTSPGSLAWYTAAYGLTSGTFVLPSGRLGDLFGHRRVFIAGFAWFALWSLLAGFAPAVQSAGGGADPHRGTIFFIVCRAMQGIGPAMLVPNGQAMLGRAYPPGARKNMVMSLFGASAPVGFVVGAAMSSLFAVYASWPWAFWTLAAVCVALGAVSALVLPADSLREQQEDDSEEALEGDDDDEDDDIVVTKKLRKRESLWARMDGTGILLGVAGLVLVNFAFNQAPIVGWATPYTYFLLILGLFFLAAFAYVEAAQAAHPLVPLAAMRSTTNFVLGCTATGWGCFSVWVYYAVQVMENLRGWSPLKTSAAFAPAPVTGLIASLLTGHLLSRGVKPHWVMLASMLAFFVGSLLFATSPPNQLYWLCPFFSILVMPFGMDMSNPAAIILLSNSVRREHQGIAASLVVTFVNYAISLALGIAGSVEAGAFDAADLLAGYRAAQYFGLGLGGLGVLFGTAFLCQSYLRTPPAPPAAVSDEKQAAP